MNFGTFGFPAGLGLSSSLFGLPSNKILWTPNRLSCELWLDAADSNTIILSSSAVSQWNDKSGNSRNASQTTPANRPTLNTLNGVNCLNFNGISNLLEGASGINDTNDFSIFIVGDVSIGRGLDGFGSGWSINSNISYFSIVTVSPTAVGYSVSYTVSGNLRFGAFQQNSKILTGNTLGNSMQNTSTGQTLRTSTKDLQIGRTAFSTGYSSGNIGEILIFSSILTDTNRQIIEGYLAYKWGFTSSLPNTHPYKYAPPMV
jgi:hypothetical protein